LGLIVAAALGTGLLCYHFSCEPALHAAARKGDAMEWLRADFHLDDRQFAAIRRIHDDYCGTCEEHCRRIQEATRLRESLVEARAKPEAIESANGQIEELRATCETALTVHLKQVAALMSPEDGRRYLSLVLPKVATFDHRAAPDLHLNRPPQNP
jgi:hypothetical protein